MTWTPGHRRTPAVGEGYRMLQLQRGRPQTEQQGLSPCGAHGGLAVLGHSKLGRHMVSDTEMGADPGGGIQQRGLGNHTGAGGCLRSVKMLSNELLTRSQTVWVVQQVLVMLNRELRL